jgi:hypothetical protein
MGSRAAILMAPRQGHEHQGQHYPDSSHGGHDAHDHSAKERRHPLAPEALPASQLVWFTQLLKRGHARVPGHQGKGREHGGEARIRPQVILHCRQNLLLTAWQIHLASPSLDSFALQLTLA